MQVESRTQAGRLRPHQTPNPWLLLLTDLEPPAGGWEGKKIWGMQLRPAGALGPLELTDLAPTVQEGQGPRARDLIPTRTLAPGFTDSTSTAYACPGNKTSRLGTCLSQGSKTQHLLPSHWHESLHFGIPQRMLQTGLVQLTRSSSLCW